MRGEGGGEQRTTVFHREAQAVHSERASEQIRPHFNIASVCLSPPNIDFPLSNQLQLSLVPAEDDVSQMIRTSFSHLPLTDATAADVVVVFQVPTQSLLVSRLTISLSRQYKEAHPDLGPGLRIQIEYRAT